VDGLEAQELKGPGNRMQHLQFPRSPGRRALEVLCLGAHCDDIEIGCGATLMRLASERALRVHFRIMTSTPQRALEARRSATQFLKGARGSEVQIGAFRDGFLPAAWREVKEHFERLKRRVRPDVIFTHEGRDLHQDHRIVSELTWNTFRDHLILEYEIPKYDGGLGQPNIFVPVPRAVAERKARLLMRCYGSQRNRHWFDSGLFLGLMRLRGVEAGAPSGYAEAFHGRKLVL
jgi:LmbE family N-acetylglucosaminyl deacetylase